MARSSAAADAVVHLAGQLWWAWPLWLLGQLPPGRAFIQRIYRWIAAHRYCHGGRCELPGTKERKVLTR